MCCTALAVIGGRYISTKISVKHGKRLFHPSPANHADPAPSVTLVGAVLFLIFGFVYLYEAFKHSSEQHAVVPPDHEEAADLLHRLQRLL